MGCKKFTVTAPRQNLSENAHFLVLRIFRFLHQTCNVTEKLVPLYCGLAAITYNLSVSSKHGFQPQQVLENFGQLTKAILPAKIPLTSFLKVPGNAQTAAGAWHCIQFLQLVRLRRQQQMRQQQHGRANLHDLKIQAGDFCLLKKPVVTRNRPGVKLRPLMYKTLFKCVKTRQKSLLLLPMLPEDLVPNQRKRQGAAPHPKYLLVDKERCKKIVYPHTYLYPGMSITEFNVLVKKLVTVICITSKGIQQCTTKVIK